MTTPAVTRTAAAVGSTVAESGDSGQLGSVLNEFAYGLLLASCNGQLLDANVRGRSELAKRSLLRLQNNAIRASHEDHAHLLAQAFARADAGRRSLLTLRQAQTPPLFVAVIPIRGDGPQRRGRAALILSRASLCETFMLASFARSAGLTHAEEQVLGLLSQGKTAPQVASELRVAVSTVRTHIQSLCSKTGCRGLRDLLSTLASLPPLAAAPVQIWQ